MRTIYVPVALPGSGKTTYYNTLKEKSVKRIDMDKFIGSRLDDILPDVLRIKGDLYLDGLFITKTSQNIITNTGENIIFLLFDVSVSTCLLNDKKRNRGSSQATIKYAKVHKPTKYTIIKGKI